MNFCSIYPVILSERIAESAAFYCQHLGFSVAFESEWYVSLKASGETIRELALLQPGHESIPVPLTESTTNLLLTFEVEAVDPIYQDLIRGKKLPCLLDLRDEPWGQRHFITRDPNGILIDIVQPIQPSEEFLKQYT